MGYFSMLLLLLLLLLLWLLLLFLLFLFIQASMYIIIHYPGRFDVSLILTLLVRIITISASHIWASTRENQSSGVCKQQRRRPACASAQSDHRLCFSLYEKYHM